MMWAVLLAGIGAGWFIHPDTKQVYVTVPCVEDVPVRPDSRLDLLPDDAAIGASVQALLIDRANIDTYTARLEAVVAGCAKVSHENNVQ